MFNMMSRMNHVRFAFNQLGFEHTVGLSHVLLLDLTLHSLSVSFVFDFFFPEFDKGNTAIYKTGAWTVILQNFETGPGPIDPRQSWLPVSFLLVKRPWLHAKYRPS